MIYVLLLENANLYVGYTARLHGERFFEHFQGNSTAWTTLHPPLQVLEFKPGSKYDEDKKTLEMMADYGWWKVRGGRWCRTEMTRAPAELLQVQNLKMPPAVNTGKRSSQPALKISQYLPAKAAIPNFTRTSEPNCKRSRLLTQFDQQSSSSQPVLTKDVLNCERCGRKGHSSLKCYAKTHLSGQPIGVETNFIDLITPPPKKRPRVISKICKRCGRSGHEIFMCYARTCSDGRLLTTPDRKSVESDSSSSSVDSSPCSMQQSSSFNSSKDFNSDEYDQYFDDDDYDEDGWFGV